MNELCQMLYVGQVHKDDKLTIGFRALQEIGDFAKNKTKQDIKLWCGSKDERLIRY